VHLPRSALEFEKILHKIIDWLLKFPEGELVHNDLKRKAPYYCLSQNIPLQCKTLLYINHDNDPQIGERCMNRKILKTLLLTMLIIAFLLSFLTVHGETVTLQKAVVRVLFSPEDDCAREIVASIDRAERYVYVAMYFFTSRPIAQAITRARDRGLDVKVCLDDEQPHYEYSKSRLLENNNIDVRYVGGSGIMHNKFCVIDDRITITGSYNWTARADLENDENVLIIDSAEIASIFKTQFARYWDGTFVDTCEYTDESRLQKAPVKMGTASSDREATLTQGYVASKNSTVFHTPDCKWAQRIKEENKIWFKTREEALDKGYKPCKVCKP
jgi:phosphatidylserine/phosphatidylglycerophosphate/cardiolipin synthase-like enzyme